MYKNLIGFIIVTSTLFASSIGENLISKNIQEMKNINMQEIQLSSIKNKLTNNANGETYPIVNISRPGDYSLLCQSEAGNYNPNMEDYVYAPEISLPAGTQVEADFLVRGSVIDFDVFPEVDYWGVQVTPNAGLNWYFVSNPYGDPAGTNYVYSDVPEFWSSFNESYTTPIDIDDYAGQIVQFRIFFHSDADEVPAEALGLWIDDFVVKVDGQTVYTEDFEEGVIGDWVSVDQTSTPAMWHQSTFQAYQGNSWRMADTELGANGGYADHWYQVLDSPEVTLPASGQMQLTFMQRRAIEAICTSGCPSCQTGITFDGWDAMNVRISTDGGNTWTMLTPTSPSYNTDVTYSFGFEFNEGCATPGWGGPESNPSWTSTTVPIPESYHGASVKVRFAFASDPAYSTGDNSNLLGVWVDNIDIAGVLYNDAEDSTGWTPASLVTVGGDLWHVEFTGEEPSFPAPTNLVAEAGDQVVNLSWEAPGGGVSGELAYDNDTGDGSVFTNGIYSTTSTFIAGEYFNTPFGARITSVKIFGFDQNTGTNTTLSAYTASPTYIAGTPTFQKSITLSTGEWNFIELSEDGWTMDGSFVIGFEVGTFSDGYSLYAPLDESAIPSANSYVNMGGWSTWQSVAQANSLPDGEWGIRTVVEPIGEVSVVYNVYRHLAGQEFTTPLWYGSSWPQTSFDDPFVFNGTTFYYAVTAVYNEGTTDEVESVFSETVEATPQSASVVEIAYDDGTAELGATQLGGGGYYAVKFTPTAYPVHIMNVKFYSTTENGLSWIKVFDDDGSNGMPGTQLGETYSYSSTSQGWTTADVADDWIIMNEGSFFVGRGESSQSPPLGIDTSSPVDGESYFYVPGESWAPIADLGYNGDLMIRSSVDLAVSVGDESSETGPIKFSLGQNYPNPFNPVTAIPVHIAEDGIVQLNLYNIEGSLVKELLHEHLSAGSHEIQVDSSNLPAGIYFYQLKTASFSDTKKMVLIK